MHLLLCFMDLYGFSSGRFSFHGMLGMIAVGVFFRISYFESAHGCQGWAIARPVSAGSVFAPRRLEHRLATIKALSKPRETSCKTDGRRRLVNGFGVAGLGILPADLWGTRAAIAAVGAIVVLGANSKTGEQCVKAALQRGNRVIATSRIGALSDPAACSEDCQVQAADVTKPETLNAAITGARGVIFAASQSKDLKDLDTARLQAAVDNEGLFNTARACVDAKVKRLVIVSCGAVSQPDNALYNFFYQSGSIRAEAIKAENRVRSLYASLPTSSGLTYTIVRPGGLIDQGVQGAAGVEVSQGDRFSGRISRADVAGLCVAAVDSDAAKNATFECYYANTAKPLTGTDGRNDALRGDTFEQILAGAKADEPMQYEL